MTCSFCKYIRICLHRRSKTIRRKWGAATLVIKLWRLKIMMS